MRGRVTKAEQREVWVMYGGITLLLGGVYFWSIQVVPTLQTWGPWLWFTGAMGLHIILHWLSIWLRLNLRGVAWLWLYFGIQVALAVAISFFTNVAGTPFGLYAILAGEAIGLSGARQRVAAALVGGIFVLATLNIVLLRGWETLPGWLTLALPQMVFIALTVALYVRHAIAREQSEQLLAELATAHQQLAAYSAQVESLTLIAERQRLARELHDTLAQGLAGLILQLEAVDSHLARGRVERAHTIVGQAMVRARSALAEARQAIDDLRTTGGKDLLAQVEREVTRFQAATGIPCLLTTDGIIPTLPQNAEEHIGRIVAEGLSNVMRHARATEVDVRLAMGAAGLTVSIQDNGVGFDPAGDARAGHYGVVGRRERARLLGGTLVIQSCPGQGTTVVLQLPPPQDQKEAQKEAQHG